MASSHVTSSPELYKAKCVLYLISDRSTPDRAWGRPVGGQVGVRGQSAWGEPVRGQGGVQGAADYDQVDEAPEAAAGGEPLDQARQVLDPVQPRHRE